MMSDILTNLAEMYCVIESLDPSNNDEWEQAVDFITMHSEVEATKYIMDNY